MVYGTPSALSLDSNNIENSSLKEDATHDAALQGLIYRTVPLCKLPEAQAIDLIDKLFSMEERFAKGFYPYWAEIMKQPPEQAWESTREELELYANKIKNNLSDPRYHSIGFMHEEAYMPVGIYGFRGIEEHDIGPKLMKVIEDNPEFKARYTGNLAIAHTLGMLDGHRNRALLRYAFYLMAKEAQNNNKQHIFFFASDYRLEKVYRRFGLDFPAGLKLPDSQHLVGSFTVSLHTQDIEATAQLLHCQD